MVTDHQNYPDAENTNINGAGDRSYERPVTALVNAAIVDATTQRARTNMTILIHKGILLDIGTVESLEVPSSAHVIDLAGKYVIPGLWDMHVNALVPELMPWQHTRMLMNGVTGFRDCGGDPTVAASLKERKRNGHLAPDFVYAGPALDGAPPLNPAIALSVTDPQTVAETLRHLNQTGVDFYMTNGMMTQVCFDRIMEEAHRHGKKVAVQGPLDYGYVYAAHQGASSIETLSNFIEEASERSHQKRDEMYHRAHLRKDTVTNVNPLALFAKERLEERILYAAKPEQHVDEYSEKVAIQLAQTLSRTEVHVCPQLLLIEDLSMIDKLLSEPAMAQVPESVKQMWAGPGLFGEIPFNEYSKERRAVGKQYFNHALHFVGALHRAGVPLLAGTHTILPFVHPGTDLHHELALLVQAGLSPQEALSTATYNAAKYLDKLDQQGTVEKGKVADLVVLEKNPLEDIRYTQTISLVIKSGRTVQPGGDHEI